MQNLLEDLTKVLSKDERCVVKGQLLKNKVIELALKMDTALIKLLLSSKSIKKHFFVDVDGVFVFDKSKFQQFVSNKEFLPDSYTAFKNKIGLITEIGNLISDSKEVVLGWAYKDCVLEGGQDKEDAKRDEVFWNETLAPDEIDHLLYPKVLTNFKRFDSKGEHKLDKINRNDKGNITDNLIFRGNNLLALHSLKKEYTGRVKLIYIDPPFNTGNDSFSYNDKFSHSTWLTFMKNRLATAYELLSDDGNIFIHIDINESHYLKILCDEMFSRDNFVEEIIWAYGSPSGGRAAGAKPVNIHDYILHYAKNYSNRKQNKLFTPYTDKYLEDWFKFTDTDGRRYRRRMRDRDKNGNVVWEKQYLDESKGLPLTTVWTDIKQVYADPRAYKENQSDVELIKGFLTQKPEKLMQRVIEMSTDEGDIVLDYHLGSGTTASVAHKMNRQYIGIEQLAYDKNDASNRLKGVIKGDKTGISKSARWQGGGSFVYCELANDNESYIALVKKAKTTKELRGLWEEMQEKAFLSYKIDIKTINDSISDYEKLSLDEQRGFLIEVLDKNMLYINYCDIDDKRYGISIEDKKLNKDFYGAK